MSNARKLAANLPREGSLSNRNLIINGAMQIAQRGLSSTDRNYGSVDRWRNSWHVNQTITQSQESLTVSDTGPFQEGFVKYLRMTQGAADAAATDYLQMAQRIEGKDASSSGWDYKNPNSYLTASFWVRSSVAGTYQIYVQTRSTTDQYYFEEFTVVADTWKKVEFNMPGASTIAIDDDTTSGMEFRIVPYYGTDYTGDRSADEGVWTNYNAAELNTFPQNWCAVSGATFDFTGVQLEVGRSATPYNHTSYQDEMQRCLRYYQYYPYVAEGTPLGIVHGQTMVANRYHWATKILPVPMRTIPSITFESGSGTRLDNKARYVTSNGAHTGQDITPYASTAYIEGWDGISGGRNPGGFTSIVMKAYNEMPSTCYGFQAGFAVDAEL